MNFTYENQGTNTYLTYAISENDEIDTMSMGMLTNNKIPGLAETSYTQIDSTRCIRYNVSAKVSARQLFNGSVNKKRLLGVFEGIVDAMLSAEEYMLDANTVLLDLDYIFTDVTTYKTVMICLPIVSEQRQNPDLGMFFKEIIFSVQCDPTESYDYVVNMMNYLNRAASFSSADFKQLLVQIKNDLNSSVSNVPQPSNTAGSVNSEKQNVQIMQTPAVQPSIESKQAENKQEIKITPAVNSRPAPEIKETNNQAAKIELPVNNQSANGSSAAANGIAEVKKISAFQLLRHYSKENVELYKAQKAAKKGAEKKADNPPPNKAKPASQPAAGVYSFSIPGQDTPATEPHKQEVQPVAKPPQPIPKAAPPQRQQQSQFSQGAPIRKRQDTMDFGGTTILEDNAGQTTVLSSTTALTEEKPTPYLVRLKNNERVSVNKPVFRIGKERSYVDYFIGDNTAISRSHADIIERGNRYFIVDVNSSNHTYINGRMIPSNAEVEIVNGTEIRLANEDFEFCLS